MFVEPSCQFWANNPSDEWDELRTGVIDPETALSIGERIHLGQWAALDGIWADPEGGVFDASDFIFDSPESSVVCTQLCGADNVAGEVKAMRAALRPIVQEMWDEGAPHAAPMRVVVVDAPYNPSMVAIAWPLSRPLSDFYREGYVEFGEGTVEDNAESLKELRALRSRFLSGEYGDWDGIPVMFEEQKYFLFMRDTLPFEDANGLVPLAVSTRTDLPPRP